MPARIIKLIYSISAVTILTLVIATITSSAQLIHFRMEVANVENEIAKLEQTQDQLTTQLSQSSSLGEIRQLAVEEGYVEIGQTVAFSSPSDSTVALR